jgi:hypothetical protein
MDSGGQTSSDTEYEVESIIGVKPHPRKPNSFLYLVTFKGYVSVRKLFLKSEHGNTQKTKPYAVQLRSKPVLHPAFQMKEPSSTRYKDFHVYLVNRYKIHDSWWCAYDDLGEEIQKAADRLRIEYFLTGDSLDTFIDSHLPDERLKEIVDELYSTVQLYKKGGRANHEEVQLKMNKILESACVQDLHERGDWLPLK